MNSAPLIALRALGRAPAGDGLVTSQVEMHCAQCGATIGPGGSYKPLRDLPITYTDQPALIERSAGICNACTAIGGREFMQTYATGLHTASGVLPFRKSADMAYWLGHLPDPPFTITISTAQMQHIHWKARVTTSRELVFVCIDGINYPVRPDHVLAFAKRSAEYHARQAEAQEAMTKTERAKAGKPRYLLLPDLDTPFTNRVHQDASADDLKAIRSLWTGETWLALRIQNQSLDNLTAPAPLT